VQSGGLGVQGRFGQPTVTYSLSVSSCNCNTQMRLKAEFWPWREIVIVPPTFPAPPLLISEFPGEFKTSSSISLRRRYLGKSVGLLKVSSEEPSPLNIAIKAPKASTVGSILLELGPITDSRVEALEKEVWTVNVKSCLKVRTFYTTRMFDKVPRLDDLGKGPSLQMSYGCIDGESRRVTDLNWERISFAGEEGGERTSLWRAILNVPVSYSKDLLPTFLNPLSARRYSLVFQLEIEGFRHNPMILGIPIQVVNAMSSSQHSPRSRDSHSLALVTSNEIPDVTPPQYTAN